MSHLIYLDIRVWLAFFKRFFHFDIHTTAYIVVFSAVISLHCFRWFSDKYGLWMRVSYNVIPLTKPNRTDNHDECVLCVELIFFVSFFSFFFHFVCVVGVSRLFWSFTASSTVRNFETVGNLASSSLIFVFFYSAFLQFGYQIMNFCASFIPKIWFIPVCKPKIMNV